MHRGYFPAFLYPQNFLTCFLYTFYYKSKNAAIQQIKSCDWYFCGLNGNKMPEFSDLLKKNLISLLMKL